MFVSLVVHAPRAFHRCVGLFSNDPSVEIAIRLRTPCRDDVVDRSVSHVFERIGSPKQQL